MPAKGHMLSRLEPGWVLVSSERCLSKQDGGGRLCPCPSLDGSLNVKARGDVPATDVSTVG